MKATAEIQTIDIGRSSQSTAVEAARATLEGKGLTIDTREMSTQVKGELDELLGAIEQIHVQLHAAGHERLATTVNIETRV